MLGCELVGRTQARRLQHLEAAAERRNPPVVLTYSLFALLTLAKLDFFDKNVSSKALDFS